MGRTSPSGGHFHLIVDIPGTHIQHTTKDARKGPNIIDLIWIIAAAGTHNLDPSFNRSLIFNLRSWVGHSEDDGILSHRFHHLRSQYIWHRHSNEHICTHNCISQSTIFALQVSDLTKLRLVSGHTRRTVFAQNSVLITGNDMLHPSKHDHFDDGGSSSAGAVKDNLQILHLFTCQLSRIHQASSYHNSCAVLVIMEHGDIQFLLQALFNLKTPWRCDILQINAAEGGGQIADCLNDLLSILGIQTDGKGIHAAELFKEDTLALHNGHSGLRPDIAQTKYRTAIGNHGHQVTLCRITIDIFLLLMDTATGLCHSRRIGSTQVIPGFQRNLALDGNLTLCLLVHL